MSVLITAFKPYGSWTANASWLALVELTQQLPQFPPVTTRLYEVDFAQTRQRLEADLLEGRFEVALHLGQRPGSAAIALEQVAINVGGEADGHPDTYGPLEADGPAAYRSSLPLAQWAEQIRAAGIPAGVSHHAGTYLCNATLYWSHHLAARHGLSTRAAFLHLPLEPSQVLEARQPLPSLPSATVREALKIVLANLGSGR